MAKKGSASEDLHCVDGILEGVGLRVGPFESVRRAYRGVAARAGYAMADHMHTSLVCQAIDMSVRRCPVEECVTIFHSDTGNQYTSQRFLGRLKSLWYSPVSGAYGGVLGQRLGFSHSTLRARTRGLTEWSIPRRTGRSRISPRGSN